MEQLGIVFPKAKPRPRHGGKRPGAGRKPANPSARSNMPHRVRPKHGRRHPVLVTMRVGRGLPDLRSEVVSALVARILKRQRTKACPYGHSFQVVHFSLQPDHVHLIVEATSATSDAEATKALRQGLSGFSISFARALNRLLHRKGKVWGDRHHRRDLASPRETRNAIIYVLQNFRKHGARVFGPVVDPYSSARLFNGWRNPWATLPSDVPWPELKARTWLLAVGWTRGGGLIHTEEVPRAAREGRLP